MVVAAEASQAEAVVAVVMVGLGVGQPHLYWHIWVRQGHWCPLLSDCASHH